MYRYSVDDAVTYTPDDFVLFRESPFASWMERLTLENPDHGIPPDINSSPPVESAAPQDEIVDTLRAEGRNVVLIEWDQDEPDRRAATLAAMRSGADFIVNGVLALGPLSGTANLLMRTSGYSELGDFLYVPCDTQAKTTFQSAFRLCFLADLLHSLQGQLPPQMLIIRGDADVVPLQTEDHIYYYRAVKKRCMDDIRNFRKHRMPDPAESSHFGRWSECASEVLKQRALSEEAQQEQQQQEDLQLEDLPQEGLPQEGLPQEGLPQEQSAAKDMTDAEVIDDDAYAIPQPQVASMGASAQPTYDLEALQQQPVSVAPAAPPAPAAPVAGPAVAAGAQSTGATLAEQARGLNPGSFKTGVAPGHTPNLAHFGRPLSVVAEGEAPRRRSTDITLQNLEFIGSGPELPFEDKAPPTEPCEGLSVAETPPPNLREVDPPAPEPFAAVATAQPAAEIVHRESVRPEIAPPATEPAGLQQEPEIRQHQPQEAQPLESPVAEPEPVPVVEQRPVWEQLQPQAPKQYGESLPVNAPQPARAPLPELEPPEPALLPPEQPAPHSQHRPHPLDSDGFSVGSRSLVDRDMDTAIDRDRAPSPDSAPPPNLAPIPEPLLGSEPRTASDLAPERPAVPDRADIVPRRADENLTMRDPRGAPPLSPPSFSDSLITSKPLDDI